MSERKSSEQTSDKPDELTVAALDAGAGDAMKRGFPQQARELTKAARFIESAQSATLAKNARRYEWLRDDIARGDRQTGYFPAFLNNVVFHGEMDDAIDAAMAAEEAKK